MRRGHVSRTRGRWTFPLVAGVATVVLAGLLVGCATGSPMNQPNGSTGTKKIAVVAAENFWGSIAAQVGGDRVSVHSIIANPDADPHDYEPTAADGRALANAQYVIENGAGY